jgi:hypothetical protein
MKVLLTLATLLTIATPAAASLSDSFQQQQIDNNRAAAKCHRQYNTAQFRINNNFGTSTRLFVGDNGAVYKTWKWNGQTNCDLDGFIGKIWEGNDRLNEREYKIENGQLVEYTVLNDGTIDRTVMGIRR